MGCDNRFGNGCSSKAEEIEEIEPPLPLRKVSQVAVVRRTSVHWSQVPLSWSSSSREGLVWFKLQYCTVDHKLSTWSERDGRWTMSEIIVESCRESVEPVVSPTRVASIWTTTWVAYCNLSRWVASCGSLLYPFLPDTSNTCIAVQ